MDFAKVLIVAVVLFGVLLAVFGGEMEFDKRPDRRRWRPPEDNETDGEEEVEYPDDQFFVGRIQGTDYKHIGFADEAFDITFKDERKVIGDINRSDVRRGIFSNEPQYIEFDLTEGQLDRMTSMELQFYVADTNQLNNLDIFLNGEEIYSGYPDGGRSYNFDIDKDLLKENNTMEISARSSWWRFWAPTVYVLEDLRINADILERKDRTFEFELDEDQADNFRMGRLILRPEEFDAQSPLVIQVNGRDIYRETPEFPDRKSMWVDFEDVPMYEGGNTVTMFTKADSLYRFESAKMVYFWESEEDRRPVKTIDVSSANYNRLPGEISFQVDRIEGSPEYLHLDMTTAEGDEKRIMIQEVLKEGKTVTVELSEDDVDVGENELEFVVGGEGGFYLSEFDVSF
ncbi:MAG: hypothetical protein ACLFQ8_03270 [Candidatus Aenigmatarchaeota archaeon]